MHADDDLTPEATPEVSPRGLPPTTTHQALRAERETLTHIRRVLRTKNIATPDIDLRIDTVDTLLRQIGIKLAAQGGGANGLNPEELFEVLRDAHANLLLSAEIWDGTLKPHRAARDRAQAAVIAEFLPEQATVVQVRAFLTDYVAAHKQALLADRQNAVARCMQALRDEFYHFDATAVTLITHELLREHPAES